MGVSTGCYIGSSYGELATLSSLNINAPLAPYKPGTKTITLGNGGNRWIGSPQVDWEWAFLSQAEIDALRDIITGASEEIYITTPINDGRVYTTFACTAHWPDDERGTAFKLTFTNLVVAMA